MDLWLKEETSLRAMVLEEVFLFIFLIFDKYFFKESIYGEKFNDENF